MFGTRSQGKVYNFVHADEIWKDHVVRELQSQKKWTEQWGYLLEEYAKLQEGLLNIGSELEDDQEFEIGEEELNEITKNDQVKKAPTFLMTNEVVDSNVNQMKALLGKYMQNNARGKNDILKLLKWPREYE